MKQAAASGGGWLVTLVTPLDPPLEAVPLTRYAVANTGSRKQRRVVAKPPACHRRRNRRGDRKGVQREGATGKARMEEDEWDRMRGQRGKDILTKMWIWGGGICAHPLSRSGQNYLAREIARVGLPIICTRHVITRMTMSAIMTETEIESQDSSSDGSNYCHRDAGWPYYTALLIFFFFFCLQCFDTVGWTSGRACGL